MIEGTHYKGSDVTIDLETEVALVPASPVTMVVTFPDGVSKEYTGAIVRFTKIRATIPYTDNTQAGILVCRVTYTAAGIGRKWGDPEDLAVLDTPTVTP